MLIDVKLQVLAAFERFVTYVTLMGTIRAVRDFMLFQRTVGWINTATRST